MRSLLAVLFLATAATLFGCGDGSENGNSGQNIFTINNLNRDTGTGSDAGDMGMEDASTTDMASMDLGDDGGQDAAVDMEMLPPPEPEIASVSPQTIVRSIDERTFDVTVNLVEALQGDARVEAADLPVGVTANVGTLRAGQTSLSLAFTIDSAPVTRTQIKMIVTRQDGNMLVGTPAEATIDLAITDVGRIDPARVSFNSIVDMPSSDLSVTFDQPVKGVGPDTVRVFSDIRGLVTGMRDGDNSDTVTFNPDEDLLADEQLQMVVTGLTTDYDDALESPVSVLFTGPSTSGTGFGAATNFTASVAEAGPIVRFDLDSDGDIDFASFDSDESGGATSRICVNDGLGNFTCTAFLGGVGVSAAVAGDFNADGRNDLVVANGPTNAIERLCINTNGTVAGLQCNDAGVFTVGYANELKAFDVNLDGRLDLVGTPASTDPGSAAGERLQACINNGGTPPQFTCTESMVTRSIIPGFHGVFDFDRDGSLDILRSSTDPARVEYCTADSDRTFDCSNANSDAVRTGDISAGGADPFVLFSTGTASQKYDVSFNAMGNINLATSAVPGLTGLFTSLFLTDYTGDGQQDGVAVQADATSFACLNGGGSPPSLTCGSVSTGISGATSSTGVVGDFNGDGIIDLVVNSDAGGALVAGQ